MVIPSRRFDRGRSYRNHDHYVIAQMQMSLSRTVVLAWMALIAAFPLLEELQGIAIAVD
jgi:hypothetical protein